MIQENNSFAGQENSKSFLISEDKWFYFLKGRKARSIAELRDILEVIDESEFKHHANYHKNDFANWIEGVFGEKELAKNMREVSEKEGIIIILDDFINKKRISEAKTTVWNKENGKHDEEAKKVLKEDFKEAAKHDFKYNFKNEVPVPEKEEPVVIIPPEKKLSLDPEAGKELSEKEIKDLVNEAMQVFEHHLEKEKAVSKTGEEEKMIDEDQDIEEPEEDDAEYVPRSMRREERIMATKPEPKSSLVIAEFIFGFVIGLIFGLIMLGILFNLRFT